jgi:hypothetical protein
VTFAQNGTSAAGWIRGVATDGALRVETDGGEERLLYSETIEVVP